MEKDHTCEKFDQLNTCVECDAPKNHTPRSRRTGGAGSLTSPLSDEDYKREMDKLARMSGE